MPFAMMLSLRTSSLAVACFLALFCFCVATISYSYSSLASFSQDTTVDTKQMAMGTANLPDGPPVRGAWPVMITRDTPWHPTTSHDNTLL